MYETSDKGMILTGKAKIDFEKWVSNEGLHEEVIYKSVINSLIIDWLDSLGIHVEIGVYPSLSHNGYYYTASVYGTIGDWEGNTMYNARQEATKSAIEKANELHNKSKNQ